jgi:hypothetical protein
MSEFLYKQKYLKYKNKYNELKSKTSHVDRLETENSVFILSDTPVYGQMNGGGINESVINLTETPTYESMEGGDIDMTPVNFTPNTVSGNCAGVVNPVSVPTAPIAMVGGDINMTPGNFTPNVVSGSCPGVVNPVVPVSGLKQKGGDIDSSPGNFPMSNTANLIINSQVTGADVYSPFVQAAGPAGSAAALANPIAVVNPVSVNPISMSNKNLSINEQSFDTTTDMSTGQIESETLSDIRNTADIERLFTQLGGKTKIKEYYSSSDSSSSSIFSSSDSDSYSDTDSENFKKY